MIHWSSLVSLTHMIGLALAVGSATVKLVLLLRCRADPAFALTFLKVSKHITRLIVAALRRYLVWEIMGTSLFYVIIVMWVFRS